jgi:hypothetical protein
MKLATSSLFFIFSQSCPSLDLSEQSALLFVFFGCLFLSAVVLANGFPFCMLFILIQ